MNPAGHLALLQEFFRDKSALFRRHLAGAEAISAYDSNNAYQYVVAREDTHLEWLRRSIAEAGGAADEPAAPVPMPPVTGAGAAQAVAADDARTAAEFLAKWQPRVAAVTHARDRKMLELVLGEVAEHQRFFAQAVEGRADLLGRRPENAGTGGGVLSRRWVE